MSTITNPQYSQAALGIIAWTPDPRVETALASLSRQERSTMKAFIARQLQQLAGILTTSLLEGGREGSALLGQLDSALEGLVDSIVALTNQLAQQHLQEGG